MLSWSRSVYAWLPTGRRTASKGLVTGGGGLLRSRSEGVFDLPEGTIYPALHRLEDARRPSIGVAITGDLPAVRVVHVADQQAKPGRPAGSPVLAVLVCAGEQEENIA